MEIEVKSGITELDELVGELVSRLDRYTKYVIVSGYIAILLGMERPTQDVDVVVSGFKSKEAFYEFLHGLRELGWETIPSNLDELYFLLEERNETINIFTNKQWYFDFKKARNKWAKLSLENPIIIRKENLSFKVAPPEIQIPYKVWLGSDKDLKDAAYLYERLKPIIDRNAMLEIAREMGVDLQLILGDGLEG